MRRGLDWYKREPRAFLDGVRSARMTDREVAVYSVILDLIYDGGGATPNDPKFIAAHFANMGSAAVRKTIIALIEMGKVEEIDGDLTNSRARSEAKTRQNLSETRKKTGRLGGVSSGKSRAASNENNNLSEPIGATYREREEKSDDDDTRAVDPDFFEEVCGAAGVDLSKTISPYWHGGSAQSHIRTWRKLELSRDEILTCIRAVTANKRDGPAKSLSYFDGPLQDAAGAKKRPDLTPTTGGQNEPSNHRSRRPASIPDEPRSLAGVLARDRARSQANAFDEDSGRERGDCLEGRWGDADIDQGGGWGGPQGGPTIDSRDAEVIPLSAIAAYR